MTIGPPPQCLTCTRWRSPLDRDDEDARTDDPTQVCTAFPLADGGIPDQIWTGRADHRQPFEGDHGLRWESDGQEFPEWAMSQAR